jgi:hypothetical protein
MTKEVQGDAAKRRAPAALGAAGIILMLAGASHGETPVGVPDGLDKVTVKGDEAQIDIIQDGLTEPVSVTQVGNTGWVAEGKLSYIIGPNKEKDPCPFTLKPAALK